MKKINRVFNLITVSILALSIIGIFGTFFSDYLISINWFGDYDMVTKSYDGTEENVRREWGSRHYWYFWSILLLFSTSVARIVVVVVTDIIEERDISRF